MLHAWARSTKLLECHTSRLNGNLDATPGIAQCDSVQSTAGILTIRIWILSSAKQASLQRCVLNRTRVVDRMFVMGEKGWMRERRGGDNGEDGEDGDNGDDDGDDNDGNKEASTHLLDPQE